ncbi:O-antigen ligase family protein [Sporosarcina sp. FSL K6-1522]|uniref:O-antigen ligase family protein n=1 Tax=Sporosarcina sp. FSL K6-1522 TaxID=2921554 RepID=UPI003159C676
MQHLEPNSFGVAKSNDFSNLIWHITIYSLVIFSVLPYYNTYTNNTGIYLGKYVMLTVFTLVLFRATSKLGINQNKLVAFFCLILLVCSLSIFNTNYLIDTVSNILMYCAVGVLAVFLLPKISFLKFKSILVVCLIATFLMVTLPSLVGIGDLSLYSNYDDRLRYFGILNNSNMLGRLALLGVLLPIRLWSFYKGFLKKVFFLFMIFSNTYLIILSDSRASMIALISVATFLIFIYAYRQLPTTVLILLISFLVAVSLIIFMFYANNHTFSFSVDLNELTSGRFAIWSDMFGVGWLGLVFGMGSMGVQGSHNGYLEIFRYFGVLGLITWLFVIFYLLIRKSRASVNSKSLSNIIGFWIVIALMIYHLAEGSMVSVANLGGIYFWLELSQRNKAEQEQAT